jgi:hypothetical protein
MLGSQKKELYPLPFIQYRLGGGTLSVFQALAHLGGEWRFQTVIVFLIVDLKWLVVGGSVKSDLRGRRNLGGNTSFVLSTIGHSCGGYLIMSVNLLFSLKGDQFNSAFFIDTGSLMAYSHVRI